MERKTHTVAKQLLENKPLSYIKRGLYAHIVALDFMRHHPNLKRRYYKYVYNTYLALSDNPYIYTHLGMYLVAVNFAYDNVSDIPIPDHLIAHKKDEPGWEDKQKIIFTDLVFYLSKIIAEEPYADDDIEFMVELGHELAPLDDDSITKQLHAIRYLSSDFDPNAKDENALAVKSLCNVFNNEYPDSDMHKLLTALHNSYFSPSLWQKALMIIGAMAAGAYAGKTLGRMVTGRNKKE